MVLVNPHNPAESVLDVGLPPSTILREDLSPLLQVSKLASLFGEATL